MDEPLESTIDELFYPIVGWLPDFLQGPAVIMLLALAVFVAWVFKRGLQSILDEGRELIRQKDRWKQLPHETDRPTR